MVSRQLENDWTSPYPWRKKKRHRQGSVEGKKTNRSHWTLLNNGVLSVEVAVAAVLSTGQHFLIERRGENGTKGCFILLTGFECRMNAAVHNGESQGGHACQMLPVPPVGSLTLFPAGLFGSGDMSF